MLDSCRQQHGISLSWMKHVCQSLTFESSALEFFADLRSLNVKFLVFLALLQKLQTHFTWWRTTARWSRRFPLAVGKHSCTGWAPNCVQFAPKTSKRRKIWLYVNGTQFILSNWMSIIQDRNNEGTASEPRTGHHASALSSSNVWASLTWWHHIEERIASAQFAEKCAFYANFCDLIVGLCCIFDAVRVVRMWTIEILVYLPVITYTSGIVVL